MPNTDWRALCDQGRALREHARTLTGHAIGERSAPSVVDPAAVAAAVAAPAPPDSDDAERPTYVEDDPTGPIELPTTAPPVSGLPAPLDAVVDYLGEGLTERTFVPTAELADGLGLDLTPFGRDMASLGCTARARRIPDDEGTMRQVRGYLTEDLRAAVERHR